MTRPRKKSRHKRDSNPGSSALGADVLNTRPARRSAVVTAAVAAVAAAIDEGVIAEVAEAGTVQC